MKVIRTLTVFFCVLFAVLMTGCSNKGVDELYMLPQQSEGFLNLQNKINEIIDNGAVYAAPTSGANRQSVQLYDVNGDGKDEVLAFFMKANEEKPLKIYVFDQTDGNYETATVIEGEGTSIDSITYSDLTGDGIPEIIVGWKISAELQMLSVYSMDNLEQESLLTKSYSRYVIGDMTGDHADDLIILLYNTAEQGEAVSLFTFDASGQAQMYSDSISPGISRIDNITLGVLRNDYSALYIESTYPEDGQDKTITDIFTFVEGKLKNITADEDGISRNTLTVYPVSWTTAIGLNDINYDGVLEIPDPVILQKPEESSSGFYVIRWSNFNKLGHKKQVMATYHNYSDSWYVEIPDDWIRRLSIRRVDEVAGEREIVFSFIEDNQSVDFMIIYTFTGENKADRAEAEGRTVLYSDNDKIFAAQILEETADGLSIEELARRFSVIKNTWD